MHTISELGTTVPAFLGKLWKLVEDPETDDLICWSPNGRSFFIRNQAQFARELLPHYYKHNNMASFVRQLNMYGFHKKVSVELGGLRCDRDEMEFAHQYFIKGHPYLLDHIKRKIATNKGQDPAHTPMKPELMNKMLTEVRSLRGRQEHFDSRLGNMKRENEALWRELALLRQKHLKQQQIVNKLIHFLVTLVQPNRNAGLPVKRRFPLMIDDRERVKQRKLSKQTQPSPTGPAIHELDTSDPELDSEYIVADILDNETAPTIESPDHPGVEDDVQDIVYDDEIIQLSNGIEPCHNTRNILKKGSKGKKKGRKNKVPIKILIPSLENEENPREETIMLEVSSDRNEPAVSATENAVPASKPVPLATYRSSKLAAMVANMSNNDSEIDIDLDSLTQEDPKDDSAMQQMMIVPEVISETCNESDKNKRFPMNDLKVSKDLSNNDTALCTDTPNGDFTNFDESTPVLEEDQNTEKEQQSPENSLSNNLSLSCLDSGEDNQANFRLEPM